jgi:hypothetical protein
MVQPVSASKSMIQLPRPRNYDFYKQYIRQRRNRYQARPYLRGVGRHYLGSFPTYHDARRAVVKFFRGELQALPPYVRAVFADGRLCAFAEDAEGYVGEIRTTLIQWRSPVCRTREEAHAAAVAHLRSRIRSLGHPPHAVTTAHQRHDGGRRMSAVA